MFENLLAGLRPPRAAYTTRRATQRRPVVEGLDDRTAPSVGVLGTNALAHLRLAAAHHHHHHHHRHLTTAPAVFVTPAVLVVQPMPIARVDPPVTTSTLTSGIQGQVRVGPISPVARPGVPNDRPLAGARIAISRVGDRQPPIIVTSDANGNFSIALTPGDFVVTALPLQPGQTLPKPPPPQTVHVSADMFTIVTIEYDTAIR